MRICVLSQILTFWQDFNDRDCLLLQPHFFLLWGFCAQIISLSIIQSLFLFPSHSLVLSILSLSVPLCATRLSVSNCFHLTTFTKSVCIYSIRQINEKQNSFRKNMDMTKMMWKRIFSAIGAFHITLLFFLLHIFLFWWKVVKLSSCMRSKFHSTAYLGYQFIEVQFRE